MGPITVVAPCTSPSSLEKLLLLFAESPAVERILIVSAYHMNPGSLRCDLLISESFLSGRTLSQILDRVRTEFMLLLLGDLDLSFEAEGLERLVLEARSSKAGLVYSDFHDVHRGGRRLHPLNDYQPGSVRDGFDFGALLLFSIPAVTKARKAYSLVPGTQSAGLYDLRLKVSIDYTVRHLREPLYSVTRTNVPSGGQDLFAYVDPRNVAIQKEMEIVFTDYLKKIDAYLPPQRLKSLDLPSVPFSFEASVIVPVLNRKATIGDAVRSALAQEAGFPFNVIVVDNHSDDGTTGVLRELSRQFPALRHVVPGRTDLGIGGCWNEALRHEACGRYAVQLDSDDLYRDTHALRRMVETLREGEYAMVVGSYTLVDSHLEEIPPGTVDHREWSDENGHNNALRVNGLGAPRAFNTALMRDIGFLNVSYGEDYAAALRICREYRIGRIYESLYLCRRWSGNTDAELSLEEINRNDAFKDRIRTDEMVARQRINRGI